MEGDTALVVGARSDRLSVRPSDRPTVRPSDRLSRLGHYLAELYERGMIWSLDHPRAVFAIAIVSLALAIPLGLDLPREILPQVDEGVVVASMEAPGGNRTGGNRSAGKSIRNGGDGTRRAWHLQQSGFGHRRGDPGRS